MRNLVENLMAWALLLQVNTFYMNYIQFKMQNHCLLVELSDDPVPVVTNDVGDKFIMQEKFR